MPINRKLLAIIGRRLPAIFDVIPYGPLLDRVALNPQPLPPGDRVALNPQPLPPALLGAAIANEFARTTWLAERFGLDPGVALKDLDDWCPTGKAKLKLPPWWPPMPEPEPHPDWAVDFHVGFAARLSVIALDCADSRLGASLAKAIDRSVAMLDAMNE
jgi:hypothetical protein